MGIKLGFVMDPISQIQFHKDSTLAMMLAAQSRGDTLYYMEPQQLYADQGQAYARMCPISVFDNAQHWATLGEFENKPLESLDCILMRQDPPFNMNYVYVSYFLELAEKAGVLIVNRPSGVRDCNEKFYTTWFPELTAATRVATDPTILKQFIREHGDCIVKPLDGMGGASVFRVEAGDQNTNVILEAVTQNATRPCMVQTYLPEIAQGDKRILVFNGKPVDHVVVRMPHADDFRGNIAAGATTSVRPINAMERALVEKIGPALVSKGLYIVGLDVIGDKISEINNTSPTCFRQIEQATDERVSLKCMEMIEMLLGAR
jgi:glutathione synthase